MSRRVAPCVLTLAIAGCTGTPAISASTRAAASQPDVVRAVASSAVVSPSGVSSRVVSSPTLPTPLTVVGIGDSLGEDLGFGLDDVLRDVDDVELVQAAKGDSGLVQPQYYDWPKHLTQLLSEHQPDVVVVLLGANDVQDFYADGLLQQFGTAGWEKAYAQRVATMMQEATDAGARVVWVGLPIMKSAVFSSSILKLNAIYQAQAERHPGVTYLPSWNLFTDAAGNYAKTGEIDGKSITLRTPDGVHITFGSGGGGADVLAAEVVAALPNLLAS